MRMETHAYNMRCENPRVRVLGFWFSFALRRVALICAVYVRLHLF
jgi:hypothetical protein